MRNEQQLPSSADVVIVGAGIVGLSIAYHLADLGQRNVVVLDRGPLGGVASPRAAGSLRHHYSHPMLVELAMRSHQFFKSLDQQTDGACGYTNNGYLVGASEEHAEWLVENVRMVRECGINTGLISRAEVRDLFPQLDEDGWSGSIAYDRDSAYVQPVDTMREIIRATRNLGVQLYDGNGVSAVQIQSRAVQGVVTEFGNEIQAKTVINAAGAWAGEVGKACGVDLPISVNRLLQIFELRPSFHVPRTRPTLSDGPLDLYARPNHGNRLLVGARHYFDGPVSPDDVTLVPDAATLSDTRRRYEQLTPESASASVYQAWAGIDGDTPDFQPVIGPTPDVQGLITAAGFSAHGFKLGPIIGKLVAELLVHGEYRTQDISALGFERFETGKLFPPGYKQMGA